MTPFVSPFPPGTVIAEEGHFSEDFPLRERLEVAAGMYLATSERRFQTPREKRERLAAIEEAAVAGDRERLDRLLEATGGGLPGLGLVGASFDVVLDAVAVAKPGLKRKRPPVGGDAAMRILVADLAAIWREGTGKRPTVTVDPYPEPITRGGPFIRFAHDVASRLGAKATPSSIAKQLERQKK
jgi:hypothetical protein